MLEKIRTKLIAFVTSDKDMPVLAGFSIGLYMILFLYSRNMGMYNSVIQLCILICYYFVLPAIVLYTGGKIAVVVKLPQFKKHLYFTGMIVFLGFFLIQINNFGISKKIVLALVIIAGAGLSFALKRYYKLMILLLLFMSLFNIPGILSAAVTVAASDAAWKKQPDAIESALFVKKPNVYYIQPDGYTSFSNLKNDLHKFDNTAYQDFLKQNGFKLYDDYRSNYASTLLSNSATFSMKHHFAAKDIELYNARDIIMGDNPVLRIFRNNGYTTHFVTQSPYLLLNRPKSGYDVSNIADSEIPFVGDSGKVDKDVLADLKQQMVSSDIKKSHFFFVEKFIPSHIHNNKPESLGSEGEKQEYLKRLQEANLWLKEIVNAITAKDPESIIIIGADHGGFVGFDYMGQSFEERIGDKNRINAIFGAQLAIKWNDAASKGFDKELKTGINLFRTVFSFLSQNKTYLQHQEDNSSYITLEKPAGLYRYIDNSGNAIAKKI